MSDSRQAEKVYKLYAEFFDKAEQERRWNPFRDIPWDDVKKDVSDDLALCAETFMAVESYLPDYVANGIQVVRPWFGRAWFGANWAYEESKHSVALLEWLMRSGKRTPEQVFDFQAKLMEKKWVMPFSTARQMTIYGSLQEMATFVIYCSQEQRAIVEGCPALRAVYRLNARDEMAHAHFYENVVKMLLEEEREETIADIAFVAKHFEMPGVGIVPEYDARIELMREQGQVDRDVFLQKVFFPLLKYIGLSRIDLARAGATIREWPLPPGAQFIASVRKGGSPEPARAAVGAASQVTPPSSLAPV